MSDAPALMYSLLDDPLLHYRRMANGVTVAATLPQLFDALARDDVRDFPAVRPHQRHPWHAFLVQLAAIAMNAVKFEQPICSVAQWREALLGLTPDDPDGAAWCLISPASRPALLQAPVPDAVSLTNWKSICVAPDELDMLVTSKNHDLKGSRMKGAEPEDWFFSLLSLQTQEGFLGAGNYGISRMNGGFASRPGVGAAPTLAPGGRWLADVRRLLARRVDMARRCGTREEGGVALLWLIPWDGTESISFSAMDPFYIEICRRVRLTAGASGIRSIGTGSKVARIAAKELNGVTGDPWTPVDLAEGKAMTITGDGFNYKVLSDLLFGGKYEAPVALELDGGPPGRWWLLARGVTRGKGETKGFHERRVPVSAKARGMLASGRRDALAAMAKERIEAIAQMRKVLWIALVALFSNGVVEKTASDSVKSLAARFAAPFEAGEDTRFFDDLNAEIEADDALGVRAVWLEDLMSRAQKVLEEAFVAGPRSGVQRYRARSVALSRFRGLLLGPTSPLPLLAQIRRPINPSQEGTPDAAR